MFGKHIFCENSRFSRKCWWKRTFYISKKCLWKRKFSWTYSRKCLENQFYRENPNIIAKIFVRRNLANPRIFTFCEKPKIHFRFNPSPLRPVEFNKVAEGLTVRRTKCYRTICSKIFIVSVTVFTLFILQSVNCSDTCCLCCVYGYYRQYSSVLYIRKPYIVGLYLPRSSIFLKLLYIVHYSV
jgi:hypothetical protein